jgi:putative addiction module component (TIGR02574 family)
MPDEVAELVARGRALAPQDRERLVEQLLASLNEAATSALHADWSTEIQRRLAEYDRGEVEAVDAAAVFAETRSISK